MAALTMSESLVRHDIAVRNIVYGSAHFLTLRLPETWEIAPGVGHPEVVAAHDRLDRKWIVSGTAWYVLYHRELGWAMELRLHSSTAPKRPRDISGMETMDVHGHTATIRRWQRRRGVFRPKTITFIEVSFICEPTERAIQIELSGRCPPEGFAEILPLMSHWWCH